MTTHAFRQVRNYLKKVVGKTWLEAKADVESLFACNKRPTVDDNSEINSSNGRGALDFTEIGDEWWQFVGFFQSLKQRMLEQPKNPPSTPPTGKDKEKPPASAPTQSYGKGSVLVSIYNVGTSHVIYVTGSISQLHTRLPKTEVPNKGLNVGVRSVLCTASIRIYLFLSTFSPGRSIVRTRASCGKSSSTYPLR